MEDVVSKYPDRELFFLLPPLFPLKCVCPPLRWKKVFQEQPSLAKLALKAAGLKKRNGCYWVSILGLGCKAEATICHMVSYLKKMHMGK